MKQAELIAAHEAAKAKAARLRRVYVSIPLFDTDTATARAVGRDMRKAEREARRLGFARLAASQRA